MVGIFLRVSTLGDSRETAGGGTLPWVFMTTYQRATCTQIIQGGCPPPMKVTLSAAWNLFMEKYQFAESNPSVG